MAGTTNRVRFDEVADLLSSGRACLAYVVDGRPSVEPVVVLYDEPRFLVGVPDDSGFNAAVEEASLVIDEGSLFFDLRAISLRGRPAPYGRHADSDLEWYVLEPTHMTCWDYGRLRVVDEDR